MALYLVQPAVHLLLGIRVTLASASYPTAIALARVLQVVFLLYVDQHCILPRTISKENMPVRRAAVRCLYCR